MTDLSSYSDAWIKNLLKNHEDRGATTAPAYLAATEEQARRAYAKNKLSVDKSLVALRTAAKEQRCITYGELAAASHVPWTAARRAMDGPNGHLDQLLRICHGRGWPLITALCVSQPDVAAGKLTGAALDGFCAGAKRLGHKVDDPELFHAQQRDSSWTWGESL